MTTDDITKISLTDKMVLLCSKAYKGSDVERIFFCESGFGCHPFTIGKAVFGYFVYDGEKCRISRWDVVRLATEEEVAEASSLKTRLEEEK